MGSDSNSLPLLKLFVFISLSGLLTANPGLAQVRLPRLVSDGMVLQRDVPLHIWGWASPGEKVRVVFAGEQVSGETDHLGNWSVMLGPKHAGGPFNLTIDGSNHVEVRNVLVGEVWVCSGQSNMELPMERVKERYPAVIAGSENSSIRQFHVPTRYDLSGPVDSLNGGKWEAASPSTVLQFSAAAYFFARALYAQYQVPIGLINCAVGGSPAEAWLSAEALERFPDLKTIAIRYADKAFRDSIVTAERVASDAWYHHLWEEDKGLRGERPWYDPAFNASPWATMPVPGFWADQGLGPVNGVVWFRKDVDVPAGMTGVPAKLLLGRIIDRDSVYVNGVFSGTIGYQYPPRRYELPAGLLKPGKNTIVVRVINSGGRGGFVPDKPYTLTANGQTIDLKGPWKYRLGMESPPLGATTFFQYKPGALFNGELSAILPYTIRGVIWYQGESNTGHPEQYRDIFSMVISDWRSRWKESLFPFLFVQLPNFMEPVNQPSESKWAELREAQRQTLTLPNTGMAVAIDLGEWNDLHPLNKEDVGRRLALVARHVAYGEHDLVWSGPLYRSMEIRGDRIILRFDETGGGLVAKGDTLLHYFAIAGADKHFVRAKARIDGDKVIVWSEQVPHPTIVRYAWADNPQGANLCNKEGLPASPFTTAAY
jgi:sialate O-acetylesterase